MQTEHENLKKIEALLHAINFVCFIVGMIGVWCLTHSFGALFFTFVASLHLELKEKL